MVIRRPSYLSLEYALSRHGILSQNVFTLTLVTPKLPYTYRTQGGIMEYHQIKRTLFRGYVAEGSVLVAEPEKALLDLVYIRYVRGMELGGSALDSLVDDCNAWTGKGELGDDMTLLVLRVLDGQAT